MRSADDIAATVDALARIEREGSDMRRPLTMDFFVAVPTHEAGEAVSARVTPLGFSTKVDQDDETGDWTCYCTKDLIPELKAVLAVEEQLDRIGQEVGGYADGFGTYGNGGRLS